VERAEPADEPLRDYVPPPDPPYVPPPPGASATPVAVNEQAPDPSDVKACAARGGKIQRVCMMGAFECVVRHRDGGKRCSDGRECSSGKCVYEGRHPAPKNATGGCQRDSDPCGCRAFVVGGRVQPALCVD
jgi:hypothetical protein